MSGKNKKSNKLDKQLIAYSLAAGTVFLSSVTAKATIHHTDFGSGIELYTDGAALDIDFDVTDGKTNFAVFFGTSNNRVNVNFKSDNASWRGGNGWGTGGTINAGASALNFGDAVNSGALWGHEATHEATSTYGNMASLISLGWGGGNFINSTGKYLGVKFMIGANTNYGWIQVDVSGTSAGPTNAVIKGYAYEDTPNGQIVAGAVPEAGSLALLAIGAAGLAAWRKKRS